MVEGQATLRIEEWLKNAFICSGDEVLEPQQAMEKIQYACLQDFFLCKLDDFSIVAYNENGVLKEDVESFLRENFNYCEPWHREYGSKF